MAAEGVEEHVACRDSREEGRIKPGEHAHAIRRSEVIFDPLHEAAVEQRLIEDVHHIRGEERPEEKAYERHDFDRSCVSPGRPLWRTKQAQ